eukprot:gene25043-10691_t
MTQTELKPAIRIGTGAAAGAVVGVIGTQAVVTGLGFTSTGIAAGSIAAGMMSAEAVVAGGGVLAGGTVATLQSLGAVGVLASSLLLSVAIVGAGVGVGVSLLVKGHIEPLPLPIARGVKHGKWMVLTEEGIGNVCYYPLDSEVGLEYFHHVRKHRPMLAVILFHPDGHELRCGGWNWFALQTIRQRHRGRVSDSGRISTLSGHIHPLVPGAVIALHSPAHNQFVRMMGASVDAKGGHRDMDDLPSEWTSEQFIVVDAGGGQIALYSAQHRRFLRVMGTSVNAEGGEVPQPCLPQDWDAERLTVVEAGGGLVALFSVKNNQLIRMNDRQDVQTNGEIIDVDPLPNIWNWERFNVVCVQPPT